MDASHSRSASRPTRPRIVLLVVGACMLIATSAVYNYIFNFHYDENKFNRLDTEATSKNSQPSNDILETSGYNKAMKHFGVVSSSNSIQQESTQSRASGRIANIRKQYKIKFNHTAHAEMLVSQRSHNPSLPNWKEEIPNPFQSLPKPAISDASLRTYIQYEGAAVGTEKTYSSMPDIKTKLSKTESPDVVRITSLPNQKAYQKECDKNHLHGTHAIVTMATGDSNARMVTALVQSLRDVNTCHSIDIIVLLSGGGLGSEQCKQGALGSVDCRSDKPTDFRVIASEPYIEAWQKLGVILQIVEPLAVDSEFVKIPGGRNHFWGMALNKLNIFGLTSYKKIMWMDGDTIALRNLDHLLFYPEFTAAFTNDCCNRNAPYKISGGLWIVEPSSSRLEQIKHLLYHESPLLKAGLESNSWHFGDMYVMLAIFTHAYKQHDLLYPSSMDSRQQPALAFSETFLEHEPTGSVLQTYYSKPENLKAANIDLSKGLLLAGPFDRTVMPKNWSIPESYRFIAAEDNWGDAAGAQFNAPPRRVWHTLNASYDWLPGECYCLPERNLGIDFYFTIHFSCLPLQWRKPASYKSFQILQDTIQHSMVPCLQDYYLLWVDAYKRGMGKYFKDVSWSEESR